MCAARKQFILYAAKTATFNMPIRPGRSWREAGVASAISDGQTGRGNESGVFRDRIDDALWELHSLIGAWATWNGFLSSNNTF